VLAAREVALSPRLPRRHAERPSGRIRKEDIMRAFWHPSPLPPDPAGVKLGSPLPPGLSGLRAAGSPLPPDPVMVVSGFPVA
jgi:hypothetical protein